MTKEREIEILMMDGCTRYDAERHMKDGVCIMSDFEEGFEDYMKEWDADEELIADYRKMIETKKPIEGWGIVEDNGETYYIIYTL